VIGLMAFGGPLGAIGPILGMKIGVGALAATGIGLAAGILLKPKAPRVSPNATDRLFASMDPNTPRKIVFGATAMATDVRYQAHTGTDQEFYHMILCVASHRVESIDEIWFDSEMAWSLSGGVVSKFSGYLTVTPRTEGASGNGIAIDGVWTSSATLTGCAYVHLRYKRTGNSKKAESPFAQNIPTRITVRGKGAFLPDLREGATAGTQGSWDWFDADSGRNPAMQLLFYLLGWRINGKLAVGRGIPPERIDLDSFITAANMCDEPVSLSAGGTEPRYRADGVFSEGDDANLVIGGLCAAMNAVLRDTGGRIGVYVLHNDLAAPVASFTEGDILDGDDWEQTPPVADIFNVVRGRWTDPSNEALYQLVDYPEIRLDSIDGIDRIEPFDQPLVQSPSQAQRLAKQRLQRNLYRGVFSANFNERAWQVNLGDVIELSHFSLGWSNKLFRVAGNSVGIDGICAMVLQEEHADIYAWDEDESPAVQPAVPTAYDALNSPLLLALGELPPAAFIQPNLPSAAESTPGVLWLDSDNGFFAARRVEGDGFLRDENDDLVLDENDQPIEAAWAIHDDQRLREAFDLVLPFGDDGQLDTTEKKKLVEHAASIEQEWAQLDARAGAVGVTTARTNAAAKRAAWLAMLAAISPPYTNTAAPSPVNRATFNTAAVEYREALAALAKAVSETDGVTSLQVSGPAQVIVKADHTGAVLAGQLPRAVAYAASSGKAIVTSSAAWSVSVISGDIDASIGASTGLLALDDLVGAAARARVKAVYQGVEQSMTVEIARQDAPPPVSGGGGTGGTTASINSFSPISSGSYATVGTVGPVTVGSGGEVVLSAPLTVSIASEPVEGAREIELKWQRETAPSTWTDVSGTEAASNPHANMAQLGTDLEPIWVPVDGSVSSGATVTGLTPSSSQTFRLQARQTGSSGDTRYLSGTATATGQ
jgi:hypothetical protein